MLRIRRLLLLLVASLALFLLCHRVCLQSAANWLDVTDAGLPADYALIMPGAKNTRDFAAAAMAKAGLVERLIVIENLASPDVADGVQLANHEITRRVLLNRGVAADRIVMLSGESSTTYTDAEIFAPFLEDKPEITVAVVTSRYHTRRVRWTMRRVLGANADRLSYVPIPDDAFHWDGWWKSEVGVRAIAGEYLKLVFYVGQGASLARRSLIMIVVGIFLFLGYQLLGYQGRRCRMAVE